MMHHVPQAGLTALAVAGPVERVVRPQQPHSETTGIDEDALPLWMSMVPTKQDPCGGGSP